VDPDTQNNKLATYHSWFAILILVMNICQTDVPEYLHLNLSKHVMRNVRRLRLCAHTLNMEAAA